MKEGEEMPDQVRHDSMRRSTMCVITGLIRRVPSANLSGGGNLSLAKIGNLRAHHAAAPLRYGSWTWNAVPLPGADSTVREPPWAAMMSWQ